MKKIATKNNLRSLALICCAIIMAASGFASFKIKGLPFYFTFQNLFAILFAATWGGMQGAAISGIVLLLGVLGLPIFSNFAHGMAAISGPTGGFLLGYFVGALLTGFFIGKCNQKDDDGEIKKISFAKIFSGCFAGFLMIDFLGLVKFFQYNSIKISMQIISILGAMKFQYYLIADAVKLIVTSVASYYLRPICAKYFYDDEAISVGGKK